MMRASIIVIILALLVGCNVCSDDVKNEADSPNGAITATWSLRDCGATTDFSSIISVHKRSEGKRSDSQVVFIAKGPKQLYLKWESPGRLLVECMDCEKADIFKQVTSIDNITIVYQGLK